MLPAMDGYQVLAALQEDAATRDLPVVILTAKAQMKDRMRCWEDGASDFVTKPFPPEQLLDSLDRVMAMTPDGRAELRESTLRELRKEA